MYSIHFILHQLAWNGCFHYTYCYNNKFAANQWSQLIQTATIRQSGFGGGIAELVWIKASLAANCYITFISFINWFDEFAAKFVWIAGLNSFQLQRNESNYNGKFKTNWKPQMKWRFNPANALIDWFLEIDCEWIPCAKTPFIRKSMKSINNACRMKLMRKLQLAS